MENKKKQAEKPEGEMTYKELYEKFTRQGLANAESKANGIVARRLQAGKPNNICSGDYYEVRSGGCQYGETTPRGWIYCTNAGCSHFRGTQPEAEPVESAEEILARHRSDCSNLDVYVGNPSINAMEEYASVRVAQEKAESYKKGYKDGWGDGHNEASSEASKEIAKNYRPNY